MWRRARTPPCCGRQAQPAIIRGVPPHWVNEPHQELAPALMVVAGSFLPPSPPRAPPSQVVVVDLLPLQGVWWVLLFGNLYSPLLLFLPWWPACSPSSPPPAPCPAPRPGPGPWTSMSFPWTILTLSRAGCLCSAFELRRYVAVEDAIFTASVFCLLRVL